MNPVTFTYPSIVEKRDVHAAKWLPEGGVEPRGIIQISHGMAEHIGRYRWSAQALANEGFIVVAKDHLGHGKTASGPEEYGYFGPLKSQDLQIADMRTQYCMTEEEYPNLPYFLLGHSMGSFLSREYITMYGDELDGVILSGAGDPRPLTISFARAIVDIMTMFFGQKYRSKLVTSMMFGSFNKRIVTPLSTYSWLTRDDDSVDEYYKDPACGYCFTLNGFAHMFANMARVSMPEAIGKIPKSLPVLFISGQQDPVGGWGKGVTRLVNKFRDAQISDVTQILFPNSRHEVLNELDKEEVVTQVTSWIKARLPESPQEQ